MKGFAYSLAFIVGLFLTLGHWLAVGEPAWAVPNAQHVCQTGERTTNSDDFTPIDVDFFVTVNNGFVPRDCKVSLSMEAAVDFGTALRIAYAIDGGRCETIIGPDFITTGLNNEFQVYTTIGVIKLGRGSHTIHYTTLLQKCN